MAVVDRAGASLIVKVNDIIWSNSSDNNDSNNEIIMSNAITCYIQINLSYEHRIWGHALKTKFLRLTAILEGSLIP